MYNRISRHPSELQEIRDIPVGPEAWVLEIPATEDRQVPSVSRVQTVLREVDILETLDHQGFKVQSVPLVPLVRLD